MDRNVNINVNIRANSNLHEVLNGIDSSTSGVQSNLHNLGQSASDSMNTLINSLGGASLNSNELAETLMSVVTSGNLTNGSITELIKVFGPYGAAIMAVVTAYNALTKVMDTFIEDAKKTGGVVSDFIIDGFNGVIDICNELADALDNMNDKLDEAVKNGVEFQEAYFMLYNYLGAEGGQAVVDFTNKLEKMFNIDASSLVGDMRSILGVVSNMGLEAEESAKAVEALTYASLDMATFAGQSFGEFSGTLERALNFGSVKQGDPLTQALDMTDADIKTFRELNSVQERTIFLLDRAKEKRGTYQRYLQTEAGIIEQLNQQYSSFMGNVGQLVLGLYAKVAPLLTKLLNLANTLVSSLAKIFNIDLSSTGENYTEGLSNISSGLEDVGESAKKAERDVASFDDVIQLSDNSDFGSNTGLGGAGNIDWSQYDWGLEDVNKELSDFEKMLERVQKHMESGEFYEAGREIITFFKDFLNDIDWDSIQDKVGEFGVGLAQFLNGLLSDRDAYKAIGKTLAESLNTGMTLLYDFAKEFDFKQLGIDLAGAWTSFWSNLDNKLFADTVYEWFSGIFEGGSNFIDRMLSSFTLVVNKEGNVEMLNGFENIGYKIADSINEFFSNLTDEDLDNIVNTFIGFIDGIFQAIGTFIETVDIEKIKEKIQDLFNRIGKSMGENTEEWGTVAHDLIMGLLNAIQYALTLMETSGITKAINDFIESLNLDVIIQEWLYTKIMLAIEKGRVRLPAIFDMLWGIIKFILFPGFDGLWTDFTVFVLGLLDSLSASLGDNVFKKGQEITERWAGVIDRWKLIFKEGLQGILNVVGELIGKILEKLSPVINGGGTLGRILSGIGITSRSTVTNIPMLASGGIANHATLAVIGEAGKEAVVPLENNTEWMDALATKVAGLMRNSGGGINSSITLDMSSISKPYYSRSEMMEFGKTVVEALKLYGVKVSLTY